MSPTICTPQIPINVIRVDLFILDRQEGQTTSRTSDLEMRILGESARSLYPLDMIFHFGQGVLVLIDGDEQDGGQPLVLQSAET